MEMLAWTLSAVCDKYVWRKEARKRNEGVERNVREEARVIRIARGQFEESRYRNRFKPREDGRLCVCVNFFSFRSGLKAETPFGFSGLDSTDLTSSIITLRVVTLTWNKGMSFFIVHRVWEPSLYHSLHPTRVNGTAASYMVGSVEKGDIFAWALASRGRSMAWSWELRDWRLKSNRPIRTTLARTVARPSLKERAKGRGTDTNGVLNLDIRTHHAYDEFAKTQHKVLNMKNQTLLRRFFMPSHPSLNPMRHLITLTRCKFKPTSPQFVSSSLPYQFYVIHCHIIRHELTLIATTTPCRHESAIPSLLLLLSMEKSDEKTKARTRAGCRFFRGPSTNSPHSKNKYEAH